MAKKPGNRSGKAKGKPQEADHERRYPEEQVIDALTQWENEPKRKGAELADLFRAVTGKDGKTGGRPG